MPTSAELADLVLGALREDDAPRSAREIASALQAAGVTGVDRTAVNQVLYGELRGKVSQGADYRWSISSEAEAPDEPVEGVTPASEPVDIRSPDDNPVPAASQPSIVITTESLASEAPDDAAQDEVVGPSADLVRAAVEGWSVQLVDLTARNNLLYFKDLRAGTLDLTSANVASLGRVLKGAEVALGSLFDDTAAADDATRRCRTIRNKAREHFEERGLETLFVAFGLATWDNSRGTATPAAPVLLAPAHLSAGGASQSSFTLSLTGELEVNPTLLQFLESEFGVVCDPDELMARSGMDGAIDTPGELDVTYRWLEQQARPVPGFRVEPRFVLGTFSYAKLPMVRDLEGSIEAMAAHPLVCALAGDEESRVSVRGRRAERVGIADPNHSPPADEFLVLDADASQNYAINCVVAGQDLIIKGPPGTGKSQTIANLIATLIARGQKVLFVAEKRAAIDAVLHRLEGVGLDDTVLDLHGRSGSRRDIAQRFAAALSANSTLPRPDLDSDHQFLGDRRDELLRRSNALHKSRSPWGMSYFEAHNRLLGLDPALTSDVRFREEQAIRIDGAEFIRGRGALVKFLDLGGPQLETSGLPWARSPLTSPEEVRAAFALVDRLSRGAVASAWDRLDAAARETGIRPAVSWDDWPEVFSQWLEAQELFTFFDPGLFDEALEDLVAELAPLGNGTFARLFGSRDFRAARKTLQSHMVGVPAASPDDLLARATRALRLSEAWRVMGGGRTPAVPTDLDGLIACFEQVEGELAQLASWSGGAEPSGSRDEMMGALAELVGDTTTLDRLPDLFQLRTTLAACGVAEVLDDLARRGLSPSTASSVYEYVWLSSIIDRIRLDDPDIGTFSGQAHSRVASEFRVADRSHIETTAQRVRRRVAEQAAGARNAEADQDALIRDQAARKRKHLSLRNLFAAAPDVILGLKPCWAMSPLLVSQVLPSERQYFDVVVFDEASQIPPADAIPAILRGKRVVVAGDERQLPPTAFFAGATAADEDDDSLEARLMVDDGFESILDALMPFLDFRMLEWHYRSQDERLIAFSNAHLYDKGLTTFPGPAGRDAIQHELVPFEPGESGSEVSSSAEVRRVVELVLEHAELRSGESLGVIAMGIKHANRIEESVRRALVDRPDLEDFFSEQAAEPFFVKNLERVQGDERDAIILSIGYGKTADGRLLYRFGPLNQQGGERRLNVAITRAKRRLTLVSSFAFEDMEPGRSSARGVELMRLYLQYAASGGANLGEGVVNIPELNAFEVDVRDRLQARGLVLHPQFGASGYKIDFAASHPHRPGEMVLAIECDGASYHSSPTARDRDRLRQEHLERLGWTFHRIWSQEWFSRKDQEIERAVAAYEAAVALSDAPEALQGVAPGATPPSPVSGGPARAAAPFRGAPPVRGGRGSISAYSAEDLVKLAQWIESDTLVRTEDEFREAMIAALGFKRRGVRIVEAIDRAMKSAGIL